MYKIKWLLSGCILFVGNPGYAQTKGLAGSYGYGKNAEAGYGYLALYNQTDSTFLFYIENGRGAPSYASGSLDGHFVVKHDSGIYASEDGDWVLHFYFGKHSVKVTSKESNSGSGYGYGVSPDGEYNRTDNKKPEYYINREGDTTYFAKYKQLR